MIGSSKRFPHFIKAASEEELHRKILKLQILSNKEFVFLTIYPVKGGVVGWYYDRVDDLGEKLKLLGESK